jgi:hypothetical protein
LGTTWGTKWELYWEPIWNLVGPLGNMKTEKESSNPIPIEKKKTRPS